MKLAVSILIPVFWNEIMIKKSQHSAVLSFARKFGMESVKALFCRGVFNNNMASHKLHAQDAKQIEVEYPLAGLLESNRSAS